MNKGDDFNALLRVKLKLVLNDGQTRPYCNTPKYTLVVFDMFRVFCKPNLTVS